MGMKGESVPQQGQLLKAGQRFPDNGGAGFAPDVGPFVGQPVAALRAVQSHLIQAVLPKYGGWKKGCR
jgi:hypothetical protein